MNMDKFKNFPDSMRVSFHSSLLDIYMANLGGAKDANHAAPLFAEFLNCYLDIFYPEADGTDLLEFQIFIVDYAKEFLTSTGDDIDQLFCDNLNAHIHTILVDRGFNPDHYFDDDELDTEFDEFEDD